MLQEALDKYRKQRPASRKLYERARSVMPGGICHNIRTWNLPVVGAYPIYVTKAKDCHIWDVDGHKYLDNWLGHMALILGHTPPSVVQALQTQISSVGGTHWGTVNEPQVELAELVMKMVPSVEMVRFCNTGSEATMYAVRLARGYTGKRRIIKQFGGWHGFNDCLNWYVHEPFEERRESLGQLPELGNYVDAVPFGDGERTVDAIKENREDLAALIFEVNMPSIQEKDVKGVKEFLNRIQEELSKHSALLILDEVITGFRLAPGGAQEYFGVEADLTTFGKILGGGLPIGCVGGRSEILCKADPTEWQAGTTSKSEVVWIGGGTFSANPLTMKAGLEILKILRRDRSMYENLEQMGNTLRSRLREILEETHPPLEVGGFQSAFTPNLKPLKKDHQIEWLIRLLNKGIFGYLPGGYLSAVHTWEDVESYLEATEEIVEEMNFLRTR